MNWSEREQYSHLLRRFGLGATAEELSNLEKLGLTKSIDALIDYEKTPVGTNISPWEFCFQDKQQIQLDPSRMTRWWVCQMIVTQRPSQEKLALFWHDHFAVSAAKVESGPLMLGYLQTLRQRANGNFRQLLGAVSKEPAMLRWLDTDTSIKGQPNENFAREVMELFTLGIGHYSEKDVQEAARACTGWSIRNLFRGGRPEEQRAQIRQSIIYRRPLYASTYAEGFHDDEQMTILGKTSNYDLDGLLDLLAGRSETAHLIATKLWSYYAYPNPEPKVVDRIAKVYVDSKMDIRSILAAIATSKEFWSDKALRAQVKSPVDFAIPFVRQLGLRERLIASRATNAGPMTPISGEVLAAVDLVAGAMRKQGMTLLYPPDVAGWDWGTAWVSPAMMLERIRFSNQVFARGRAQVIVETLNKQIGAEHATPEAVVDALVVLFDVPVDQTKRAILLSAVESGGGAAVFQKPQTAVAMLNTLARLMFAMPEYQFC